MKRHPAKEWTVEEFDDWVAAGDRHEAVGQAADEEGGPSLSLVPATERNEVWPTDLLPPANASAEAPAAPPIPATPFDGVVLEDSRKRLAGWSAERQRLFLCNLAETGSVHLACAAARLSARSAYRLRARSPAFAAAWDTADQLAVGRLSALAFDRAINGRTEQVWHEGNLVAEKTRAERPAAHVVARPARSPPLRRALGAAQGRRRRSSSRGAGELPGAARRPRRCRVRINAMASANIGTFRAGARRAAKQCAGGQRPRERPADGSPRRTRSTSRHNGGVTTRHPARSARAMGTLRLNPPPACAPAASRSGSAP
jgi:hypothetical protein